MIRVLDNNRTGKNDDNIVFGVDWTMIRCNINNEKSVKFSYVEKSYIDDRIIIASWVNL